MAKVLVVGENPRKSRKRRKRRASAHRRAAAPRRRRRSRKQAVIRVSSNPIRGRRRKARRHHYRRNPIGGATAILMPAGIGALAAVAVGIGVNKFADKLPASLQTGYGAVALQAGLAVLTAWGLPKLGVSRRVAYSAGAGIATIALYSLGTTLVAQHAPTLAAGSGVSGLGERLNINGAFANGMDVGRLTGPTSAFGERFNAADGFGERMDTGYNPNDPNSYN